MPQLVVLLTSNQPGWRSDRRDARQELTTCSNTGSRSRCEKSCACTTCHVVIREGFNDLTPSEEDEDDLLDKAWGLEPTSRLSCQAIVKEDSTAVEIPKYSINHAKENH